MTVATKAVRVVIADDQTLFRAGLARLLNEDPRVEVIGQAQDGVADCCLTSGVAVDGRW